MGHPNPLAPVDNKCATWFEGLNSNLIEKEIVFFYESLFRIYVEMGLVGKEDMSNCLHKCNYASINKLSMDREGGINKFPFVKIKVLFFQNEIRRKELSSK